MNNQFLNIPDVVYHGTTSNNIDSIKENINVNVPGANPKPDFGKGFYTTTNASQAAIQAQRKTKLYNRNQQKMNGNNVPVHPVVVEFRVDKDKLERLASCSSDASFLTFNAPNEHWGRFVLNNRTLRKDQLGLHNIDQKFHYVYGPLADGFIGGVVNEYQNNEIDFEEFLSKIQPHKNDGVYQDQFSVHTKEAANCLIINELKEVNEHGKR